MRRLSTVLLALRASAPKQSAAPEIPAALIPPGTATLTTASGIRIDAIRMGWVGVKPTHRELEVPS